MDPVTLAEHLKRGLENDQIYVVPYDNAYELISRTQEQARNFASPEGMVKEAALAAYALDHDLNDQDTKMLREKGPAVGFAKARSDIDWVDTSRKF
jgi:hypothetical protein